MDWDSVKNSIKRAARSLFRVVGDLNDAKVYHDERSHSHFDDKGGDRPHVKVPLLWGRF